MIARIFRILNFTEILTSQHLFGQKKSKTNERTQNFIVNNKWFYPKERADYQNTLNTLRAGRGDFK
ncbi:MAG: hypothetical protein H6622_14050 [Halobacteriovoraceae bacterium]|nr:hypothetical protein [Halobacteriovoraceae bacterium]